VGHAGEVVAAVGLGEEVGDRHVVEGAGERVEAEEVEDGDVGRDLGGGRGHGGQVGCARRVPYGHESCQLTQLQSRRGNRGPNTGDVSRVEKHDTK
jgi:hypothetical protein